MKDVGEIGEPHADQKGEQKAKKNDGGCADAERKPFFIVV